MNPRIVITGMGAVTPVGIGVDAYWQGLMDGKCAIRAHEFDETQHYALNRMALVENFQPKEHLPGRMATDLDPFMQYAFTAGQEALRSSGLEPAGSRTGIVMGTALAGIAHIGQTQAVFSSGKQVSPRFLTKVMGNIAAAQFAIQHQIKGPSMTVTTACSSGGDAILLASMLLRAGAADAMVVLAGESAVSPLVVNSLAKAGALSKTGESLPFDQKRNGFVIGEGGGALILETLPHAQARGAAILAELLGCANNTDAYHPVSPAPDGSGAADCMRLALDEAGLKPEDIGYINAHGTATAKGDIAEACAINAVFPGLKIPVSSTKGGTGHMMGAGGITELIACIKAVETGHLPQTVGLTQPDEQCPLDLVYGAPRACEIQCAMSNALGFGGQNSSVIIGKLKR